MAEIVRLDEHRPHSTGTAICMECRHEWQAVAPMDVLNFDCPACGCGKGIWRNPFGQVDGKLQFRCRCDNEFFVLMPDKIMCARCGQHVKPY